MKKNKFSIGYWIIKVIKYDVGFWVVDVIKSCKTEKQLEGAVRLLYLFENNFKYDAPYELIKEIYNVYYKQKKDLISPMEFDPNIHL